MRVVCLFAVLAALASGIEAQQSPVFSGHWDRSSSLESFANTPGGTRLRYRLALPYGPLVRLDVRLTVR